jgi:hypothetical protein
LGAGSSLIQTSRGQLRLWVMDVVGVRQPSPLQWPQCEIAMDNSTMMLSSRSRTNRSRHQRRSRPWLRRSRLLNSEGRPDNLKDKTLEPLVFQRWKDEEEFGQGLQPVPGFAIFACGSPDHPTTLLSRLTRSAGTSRELKRSKTQPSARTNCYLFTTDVHFLQHADVGHA